MTVSAGDRFLLVTVDNVGRPPKTPIALLALELQHAAEVAEAPEVTDEDSLRRLFARGGWQHSKGFETAHAAQITRVVEGELAERTVAGADAIGSRVHMRYPPDQVAVQRAVQAAAKLLAEEDLREAGFLHGHVRPEVPPSGVCTGRTVSM